MLKKKIGKIRPRVYKFLSGNGGFGMNELLGIAIALIIAAFIIIPGLKIFAGNVMSGLNDWWNHTIVTKLFPIS